MSIETDALESDDATAIRTAILNVQTFAYVQAQAMQGIGFDVALERAGDLVRSARAKLEGLPPNAAEAERQQAQTDVQRLESMFFGQGSQVLEMLRVGASRSGQPDGGGAILDSQLHALGADKLTIASERLRAVPVGDVAALIAALRKVASEDRIAAMQRSGQLDTLSSGALKLTPDQRELVKALLWQGAPPIDLASQPGATATESSPPLILPPGLGPSLLGPRPEFAIALHDILEAMGRSKPAVHEVLSRLARMSDEDQHTVYADPRYRAKLNALPEGHTQSRAGHVKDSLRMAERSGARAALLAYPATEDGEQKVQLEALGMDVDADERASLRRAYVLVERLGGEQVVRKDPALLNSLAPEDRRAVERLIGNPGATSGGLLGKRNSVIGAPSDKETANQLIFGQPQLTDTPNGALDPAMEAEFMYLRLREAAGIRGGVEVMDSFNSTGPAVDESVAEFMVLYRRVRPAGVNRGDLAQLAELYHRATRRLDAYRKANDSFASSAAQVVGAVVGTVVLTIASGGTLGPLLVGAVAGLSAAAGAAAAGAAIRIDNTMTSVLSDAGTGAIEGVGMVAGAALASKIIRGAAMGVSAGRAAVAAGARATSNATGGLAASIAETAIDSAIGSAAGELFQTAIDEATWDRGISEAFAAMLAAIARGAGTGLFIGGAIGGAAAAIGKLNRLAARLGEPTASDVRRILDSAGIAPNTVEHLSEQAQDQLARAVELVRAGQIDDAERLLASIDGLAGQSHTIAEKIAIEKGGVTRTGATFGDDRARVTGDRLGELSRRLKVRVEIDETGTQHDGIELHYVVEAHRTIRPTVLRVGPEALIDDVLVHGHVTDRITRYNSLLGKLRYLWDRLVALVKRSDKPLRPGQPAWESYQELAKLDELIARRQAQHMGHGTVDPTTLEREIEFLERYRAHHEAIIADGEKGIHNGEPAMHIDSPDSRHGTPSAEHTRDGPGPREPHTSIPATSSPDSGDYSQADVVGKLAAVRPHLTETHFDERAWRETGPGHIIRVRDGRRQPSVPARQLAHLEPDAAHQVPGREIVRVEVLVADGERARGAIGEIVPRATPPHGTRHDVPVDPSSWLRLHLADGSHVDWRSGPTPPSGFRFQITPNSHFRNYGFSGGHTRDAWNETMRVYGDQIRELPADHLAFTLREHGAPIDVTIQPYEVRGVADSTGTVPWTRVRYPKSIFEGAGVSSILELENYMAPYLTAALNASPAAQTVDVAIPVRSLTGEPVDLRLRIVRDVDTPGRPITSWWVSETGIDARLRRPSNAPVTEHEGSP